jgi:hypothetical protein
MMSHLLRHPHRRNVIRTPDDQRDFSLGFRDGQDSAILGREGTFSAVRLSALATDLRDVRQDIEAGRLKAALDTVARALGMSAEDVFGLLPVPTGSCLFGWCSGLLSRDRSRFMDEPDPDAWADTDEPAPVPRLYGR